jgi:elongation factor Ts
VQCKKEREDSKGDMKQAILELRKKSNDIALKKGDRELGAGVIASYIHSNKTVGTLVELACETDFVARNEEFIILARDIAMHIAASAPLCVDENNISPAVRAQTIDLATRELCCNVTKEKLKTYLTDKSLLAQPFVKNPEITVQGLINNGVQKFGERIAVSRFARFSVGA